MIINQQKSTQTYLTYQCTYDKNYKALTELKVSIISSQKTMMDSQLDIKVNSLKNSRDQRNDY